MAPPQRSIERRGTPNLHLEYGKRWGEVLNKDGYFYMGDTRDFGTRRSPHWRPSRVLRVTEQGEPIIWRNACPHNMKQLVQPTDLPEKAYSSASISCPWHRLSLNQEGEVQRTGQMKIDIDALPEQRCSRSEHHVWQGLVFELGKNTERARQNLVESLAFVDQVAGHIFDLTHYRLMRSVTCPQKADALTSMINYLDIRHIPGHRDTLFPIVDMKDYRHWANDAGVMQVMGLRQEWLDKEELGNMFAAADLPVPTQGAAWFTSPLGFMLEWYPGVIVVSQCLPDRQNPMRCTFHHDFFYDERMSTFYIAGHQEVFKKTGDEDDVWCGEATANLEALIEEGQGAKPWGFLDPDQENYATWYYERAEKEINALISQ